MSTAMDRGSPRSDAVYLESEYRRESRYLASLTAAASILLVLGAAPWGHSAYRAFSRMPGRPWFRHESAPAHRTTLADPVQEQRRLGRSAARWSVVPIGELPLWEHIDREPLRLLWQRADELTRHG